MRLCEVLFTVEQADAVQRLVQDGTGQPCPCTAGRACPLLSVQCQEHAADVG